MKLRIPTATVAWFATTAATAAAHASAPNESLAPTYADDVAPILRRSCEICHRPGSVGPMSLGSFEETRAWAKAIRESVVSRRMPPWFADPGDERFANDPALSEAEIATVAAWVEAGAPRGDPALEPPPLDLPEGWTLGAPDLELAQATAYRVPDEGEDRFLHFELDPGLAEDRWIRSVEVLPGDARAVHHLMAYVLDERTADEDWSLLVGRGAYLLTEYAAGNPSDEYPPGTGRLLKAGARLLVQIHYHPFGEATEDRSRIGLRFAEGPLRPVVSRPLANFDLAIPPGAREHPHEAAWVVDRASRLLSIQPHMHFRGKAMRLVAEYPDGRTRALFSTSRYDPAWQISCVFAEPPLLPAGTTLRMRAIFDNSADNPLNPDPGAAVFWGPRAFDEMAIGWIDLIPEEDDGGE